METHQSPLNSENSNPLRSHRHSLRELSPGEEGIIHRISSQSPFKRRLLEMGFVSGAVVQKLKLAPLADPAEYLLKGYHISLRNEEAKDILLMTIDNAQMATDK